MRVNATTVGTVVHRPVPHSFGRCVPVVVVGVVHARAVRAAAVFSPRYLTEPWPSPVLDTVLTYQGPVEQVDDPDAFHPAVECCREPQQED